jgi:hypothetical protein
MNITKTEVVLDQVNLTRALQLQKIALLDYGVSLEEDGSLPEGKYGTYWRVCLSCGDYGEQFVTDYTMFALSPLNGIVEFFVRNK